MMIRAVVIVTPLAARLIISTSGDVRIALIVSLKLGGVLFASFFGGGGAFYLYRYFAFNDIGDVVEAVYC